MRDLQKQKLDIMFKHLKKRGGTLDLQKQKLDIMFKQTNGETLYHKNLQKQKLDIMFKQKRKRNDK